jgi:hypothetical protein
MVQSNKIFLLLTALFFCSMRPGKPLDMVLRLTFQPVGTLASYVKGNKVPANILVHFIRDLLSSFRIAYVIIPRHSAYKHNTIRNENVLKLFYLRTTLRL